MSAEVKGRGEGRAAGKDREARALAGIVIGQPADAAHRVRQPGPQLDHRGVGAPANRHRPAEFDGPRGDGIQRVAHVGGEPGIRQRARKRLLGFAVLGGYGHLPVLGHVEEGPLVGAAQDGVQGPHVHQRVRFYGEGEFGGIETELERWSQRIENEPFALAEIASVPVGGIEGFPKNEFSLAVP